MINSIRLELRATLKSFNPPNHGAYPVKDGLKVREILTQLDIPEHNVNLVFVDGVLANLDTSVEGGERVTLFPPLCGG